MALPRWVLVGAAAVAVVLVAEVSSRALDPGGVLEPVSADEGEFFTDAELERARDYRSGQRLLFVGGLVAEVAVLGLLVAGHPHWATRGLERAAARPLLGGAAAVAGVYLAVQVVGLPFSIAAHERAVDVGLSTQSLGEWALDAATAIGIGTLLFGVVGAVALALMRRFGGRWWIPGSAAFVALAVVFTWIAPVVLAPVYNDFEPLPSGQVRSDVFELADEAGVDVGEVYSVDASRRTTRIGAYVDGLGSTKRVVVYDNLIDELDSGERRSVLAHELAHAENQDLPKGLLWVALVTPFALLLLTQLAATLSRRSTDQLGVPPAVPALGLALVIMLFVVNAVANRQYREVEARADARALELTDDPQSLIRLRQEAARINVTDPSPPSPFSYLFGTHPTTMQRIGAALAWERGERP